MSSADTSATTSSNNATMATVATKTECSTTYVMIPPPENGSTMTVQTKGELVEALEGSGVEESEMPALVMGEEDLSLVSQPQMAAPPVTVGVGWSKSAVLKLIQLHKEHQHLFDDPHFKKKSVWEMVAVNMHKEGYRYSWSQAENKWKAITKKYRDTVNYNERHGHILQRKCPFYNELSAFYEYTSPRQNQRSTSSLSTLKPALTNNTFQQRTVAVVTTQLPFSMKRPLDVSTLPSTSSSPAVKTVIVENQPACDEQAADKVLVKKKKYNPSSSEGSSEVGQVLHMLRVLNEDRRKQEKQRMERLEKMHQEKMSMFREFLDVFKKSLNKDASSTVTNADNETSTCDSKSSSNGT